MKLGEHQDAVEAALERIAAQRIIERIWEHDHTVWKPDPEEISNRLGWLRSPQAMMQELPHIEELVAGVRSDGYDKALLLGMGGSSLAPQVFRRTFGVAEGYLDLSVLDSTDPGAVQAQARRLDPAHTLFIVATKSGSTVETLSFFKFFYNWAANALGPRGVGKHFIAITDPGSKLVGLASEFRFRQVCLNDPDIGGRYSALSYFGLVPAALVGVDVARILRRAGEASAACGPSVQAGENPGAILGAALGETARSGRDKLTLVLSPAIASFGDWVEQLIAESTGKEGKGILPVVGEPLGEPRVYGGDRLFVHLKLEGDETHDEALRTLENAGQPIIELEVDDLYDLSEQYFLWEMATAVAGYILGIHPFNQPNVEAAKILARRMVEEYIQKGELPAGEAAPVEGGTLEEFLHQAEPGDYVCLQAYLQPLDETSTALQSLRTRIRDRYQLATTVGYGPRFLHSTGQLHKGDSGNGLFVQFTSQPDHDAHIPDEAGSRESAITFGVLKLAQALGDAQALREAGRRVITFPLGKDPAAALDSLAQSYE